MNLLVDLGNSRFKWALAAAGVWRSGVLGYDADLHSALEREWTGLAQPRRVVAASVGGSERAQVLSAWVRDRWSLPVHFLEAARNQLGVTNTYDEPASLGSDRWAALIAAHHLGANPACIVDCGTAVTVDALAADGVFIGGIILPGVTLMRDCLRTRSAGIRRVDGRDDNCLAHNTADGVSAGTVFGLAGAVARIVGEFRHTLGAEMRMIITGGDAPRVVAHLDGQPLPPITHEPKLVLKGLELVANSLP